jgi:hypothetical protein
MINMFSVEIGTGHTNAWIIYKINSRVFLHNRGG